MLHHFSIAAENPGRVAQALAELFNGEFAPFPPHPGSFMAIAMMTTARWLRSILPKRN